MSDYDDSHDFEQWPDPDAFEDCGEQAMTPRQHRAMEAALGRPVTWAPGRRSLTVTSGDDLDGDQ